MTNFVHDLIMIANEDMQDDLPRTVRDIRDQMIEKMFCYLSIRDKFVLACALERAHFRRRLEDRYPGKYDDGEIVVVVDQLVRALRDKEAKSGKVRSMPFTNGQEPK